MGQGQDTPSLLISGPAFPGKVGSVLVSDAADLSVPAPSSAHTTRAALEDDAICEVHLESDFATLHSSTPGEQLLEVGALPEGR